MEYKKKPNSYKGYIDVQKVEEEMEEEADIPLDEIRREEYEEDEDSNSSPF